MDTADATIKEEMNIRTANENLEVNMARKCNDGQKGIKREKPEAANKVLPTFRRQKKGALRICRRDARQHFEKPKVCPPAVFWILPLVMPSASPKLSGPKGSLFFGNLPKFGRDPLALLESCARDYGDFVPLRFVNKPVVLLNDPQHIEFVLASGAKNFRKTIGYRTPFMRRLFGQGLLTSEGEFWTRQRRLSQPAFHRERVAGYAKNIVEFAQQDLATWKVGETRPTHLDMMRLTTRVVVKSLFNSPVPPEIDQLGEASAVVMERFTQQWSGWRMLLSILPNASSRRFEKVMRDLDNFIYGLIRERRASGEDTGDLLSMLLQARDDDGKGMSDQQLRDELTTLMVAGLDTTALTLAWAFYLLSQNPGAEKALLAEIDSVLQGRAPTFADLPCLPCADAVVKETMRLYPAGWLLGREAVNDVQIGGFAVGKGTSVIMSQWLKHRDARCFPEPEKFLPERWRSEEIKKLPKFAYFPFGGGPRICIGNAFAMMEAVLVLAVVLQKFRLTAEPGYVVKPWPSITLQPKGGIFLKVIPVAPTLR
jgi:cytochrome P450